MTMTYGNFCVYYQEYRTRAEYCTLPLTRPSPHEESSSSSWRYDLVGNEAHASQTSSSFQYIQHRQRGLIALYKVTWVHSPCLILTTITFYLRSTPYIRNSLLLYTMPQDQHILSTTHPIYQELSSSIYIPSNQLEKSTPEKKCTILRQVRKRVFGDEHPDNLNSVWIFDCAPRF